MILRFFSKVRAVYRGDEVHHPGNRQVSQAVSSQSIDNNDRTNK